ncbi:M48 family metallopeptidase [Tsuneonella mangrovi]|uniref:M48 family metallopeptidase n=1 Tax=Tsuneonella mangrovi TaxID=1982042 RepID=UPI000BA222F5|nr:M48 family metallopeptidase [Tsuneonella mangrovi]
MIDWLRAAPSDAEVTIGGRTLPIEITRNRRARRLTMRLAPDGNAVRLTLPGWCRTAEALAFVHARTEWLNQQLAKVPERCPPEPGGTLSYRGNPLAIDWRADAPRKARHDGQTLTIGGPLENLASRLQRWLEGEALRLLEDDLAFYAERAGIETPKLALSRARRRWGSCSTGGTVRINWRLVQAPDHVRRSVVAHEVAHCLHFDHSPAFHAALAEIFDSDIAAADGWIKAHGRTLYATFG